MRWRWGQHSKMISNFAIVFTLLVIGFTGDVDARRHSQRRKDSSAGLYIPAPSASSIQAVAQATGAAEFEHYTEGRALVKRLIPNDSQPDLDVVEHQGVIGKAGVDFPAFPNIPNTGFNCKNVPTGYYADLETDCQVFHICDTSRKISFLCPNGTIFSQSHLICDWWFKVDCASAPALYESSAEYYSNEQKKSQRIAQTQSKPDVQANNVRPEPRPQNEGNGRSESRYNQYNDRVDRLQQLDSNVRAESRRTSVNVPSVNVANVASTTERFYRTKQRFTEPKATSRSFQSLFTENYNPTQRTQATTAFENRRKNLVQLIANNFANPLRVTPATYVEPKSTPAVDYNNLKEMQVVAETANFASNNNRQFLENYNKNYRPYPVYNPTVHSKVSSSKTNPTLTTLYDIRDKTQNQNQISHQYHATTKRPTLVPYTKSYTVNDKHEPYTRPGVSLLRDFLEKEKNKTVSSTTDNIAQVQAKNEQSERKAKNKILIESKSNFETATKIPQTTRGDPGHFTQTPSSDRLDIYRSSSSFDYHVSTEPSYQERRERLMRKLNLDTFTTPTEPTTTEKFYGDLPNRPGLIVPPSLTPKTLHTLAIYYATALDNLSTTPTPEETETATPAFDDYEAMEEVLPNLFSQQTINKYSKLFSETANNADLLEEIKFDPNGTYNEIAEDLMVQQSQNPIAASPQIRELAQVFTHALSAYLQDPVKFRKVLSDIRPTHPSFDDMLTTTEESANTEPTTTVNEEDDEILGFSDDNKARAPLVSLRDGKSLNLAADYTTISEQQPTTVRFVTETTTTARTTTTPRNPFFRCCGRISASYTSASTPKQYSTTPLPYTNTIAEDVNTLQNRINETPVVTTENTYIVQRFGGFQNNSKPENDSPYGKGVKPIESKPLSEYVEATNLPSAWGVDVSDVTSLPITNSHINVNGFESKKIKPTTYSPATTPIYFTVTDASIELENEEELQRAHSQSFINQNNNQRQGKQLTIESQSSVRKPAEDLEAPTVSETEATTVQTTTQPTTTIKDEAETLTTISPASSSIFTSPDSDKTTFQWPSTYENWQSTIVDPLTLNDGLIQNEQEQVVSQTSWTNTATPSTQYAVTTEQTFASSIKVEQSTPETKLGERSGRLLKDFTSTEPSQDISTIAETVVEKAKEIMGGMNATTTEKLMNVMKKTKSKTVRRLILLLVQTCDDDHNTTAEASKKALLEALMAVSQKDMDELAKTEGVSEAPTTVADYEVAKTTNVHRRTDRVLERQEIRPRVTVDRRGKSLNIDASAINSLSNTNLENGRSTTERSIDSATLHPKIAAISRGGKKFAVRTTLEPRTTTKAPFVDIPIAEARTAPKSGTETKAVSDTRALELLRSLYTIAAKWG